MLLKRYGERESQVNIDRKVIEKEKMSESVEEEDRETENETEKETMEERS
jgi:hypothetical protein